MEKGVPVERVTENGIKISASNVRRLEREVK